MPRARLIASAEQSPAGSKQPTRVHRLAPSSATQTPQSGNLTQGTSERSAKANQLPSVTSELTGNRHERPPSSEERSTLTRQQSRDAVEVPMHDPTLASNSGKGARNLGERTTGAAEWTAGSEQRTTPSSARPIGLQEQTTHLSNQTIGLHERTRHLTGTGETPIDPDGRLTGTGERLIDPDHRLAGTDEAWAGTDGRLTRMDEPLVGTDGSESPRDCRRLLPLRGWSDDEDYKEVPVHTGGQGTSRADGVGSGGGARIAVGGHSVDRREDWVRRGDVAALGPPGRA